MIEHLIAASFHLIYISFITFFKLNVLDHDLWDSGNVPPPVNARRDNFTDFYDIYEELGK